MNVTLLAHTQLTKNAEDECSYTENELMADVYDVTSGQVVALAAIRQCYSHKTALEVLETESAKYFGDKGKESKRLFKQIVSSGHVSTMEHISFTFAIENVSRALLAQLTRHRAGFSYSVQSQRYVKLSSESRSGGFDYVKPKTLSDYKKTNISHCNCYCYEEMNSNQIFEKAMKSAQEYYDALVESGIPQEDARAVLPNATATNLVLTVNLRALLDFYSKRKPGNGAQAEITELAEKLKDEVLIVEPWTREFFE